MRPRRTGGRFGRKMDPPQRYTDVTQDNLAASDISRTPSARMVSIRSRVWALMANVARAQVSRYWDVKKLMCNIEVGFGVHFTRKLDGH